MEEPSGDPAPNAELEVSIPSPVSSYDKNMLRLNARTRLPLRPCIKQCIYDLAFTLYPCVCPTFCCPVLQAIPAMGEEGKPDAEAHLQTTPSVKSGPGALFEAAAVSDEPELQFLMMAASSTLCRNIGWLEASANSLQENAGSGSMVPKSRGPSSTPGKMPDAVALLDKLRSDVEAKGI